MTKANFHMHTLFCDGKSSAEEYVLIAIKKGIRAIGFSAHVPVPMLNKWSMPASKTEDYFAEISRLKEKYAKEIEIYTGFEMDYLITADKKDIHKYIAAADYTIGSVHCLYSEKNKKYYAVDGTALEVTQTLEEFANGDIKFLVRSYYEELVRIIHEFKPDIIGHFDIIKKRNQNNIFFNETESWYRDLVKKVLDKVVATKTSIEVNTGGKTRGYISETYPSPWILKECLKRNIPIIISSDAHKAADIDGFFSETIHELKALGFSKQMTLQSGKWTAVDL
jgi:histidinol-phosphatase (PHP family)